MQTKKLYDEYMITSMVPGFDPVEVASAEGTRVRSVAGEEYLDCFSGIAAGPPSRCDSKTAAIISTVFRAS